MHQNFLFFIFIPYKSYYFNERLEHNYMYWNHLNNLFFIALPPNYFE